MDAFSKHRIPNPAIEPYPNMMNNDQTFWIVTSPGELTVDTC